MTLLDSLLSDLPRLSTDEQRAVRFILDRILVVGRATYAPWAAATDGRDMDTEIAEECADAVVYTGMRAVMRALAARQRLDCARSDDAVDAVDRGLAELDGVVGERK